MKLNHSRRFYTGTDYREEYWGNMMRDLGYEYVCFHEESGMHEYKYKDGFLEQKFPVGSSHVAHYAAPGYGYNKWKVVKVDEKGVWGETVEDTGGILDICDVI